jgi:hypothetical protein
MIGWFGKGIYFTSNPEYALRYSQRPTCLMMCYVILQNPYPVIFDDASNSTALGLKLYGRANYKNYGCHFVPVKNYGGKDYRPPRTGNNNILLVIFLKHNFFF